MKEFIRQFAALITGAFSLLAALAWNDTIKVSIQQYISPGSTLESMFIYAVIITIVAVLVTVYLNKLAEKLIKREEKLIKQIEKLKEDLHNDKNKK